MHAKPQYLTKFERDSGKSKLSKTQTNYDSLLAAGVSKKEEKFFWANSVLQTLSRKLILADASTAHPLDLRFIFISQDQRKGEEGRFEGCISKRLTHFWQ